MPREMPAALLSSPYCKLQRTVVKNKLRRLFKLIGSDSFTEKQLAILSLVFRGLTESEIANRLEIHQTSVHKSIFGNLIYRGEYFGRRHGGILTKMRKKCYERNLTQEWLDFEHQANIHWGEMLDSF